MHCQNISLAQYFSKKAFIFQLVGSKLWEVSDGRDRPYYLTFVCQMVSLIGKNKSFRSFNFCMSLVITERLCITDKEIEIKLEKNITFNLTKILWTWGLIIGFFWVVGVSFLFYFFPFF